MRSKEYSLEWCWWHDQDKLLTYLEQGWEPFAVTESDDGVTVWLRYKGNAKDLP